MTLTEFVAARLDEDEAVAKAATLPAHDGPNAYKPHPELSAWRYVPDGEVEYVPTPEMLAHNYYEPYPVTADSEGLSPAVGESVGPHIARHDPARVLAEVEAKRRVLARHRPSGGQTPACEGCGYTGDNDDPRYLIDECPELRDLATIHADHPAYRQEWRP
jgi:hypothetical protein